MSEAEGGATELPQPLRRAIEMLRRGEALLARRVLASAPPPLDTRGWFLLHELWSFDLFLRLRVAEDVEMFRRVGELSPWLAQVELLHMLQKARVEDLAAHLRQLGGAAPPPPYGDFAPEVYHEEDALRIALHSLRDGRTEIAAEYFRAAYAAARARLASVIRLLESPHPVRSRDLAALTWRGSRVERRVWGASLFKRLEDGTNVLESSVMRVAEEGVGALLADREILPSSGSRVVYSHRDFRVNRVEWHEIISGWFGVLPRLKHKWGPWRGMGAPRASYERGEPATALSSTVQRTPHMDLSAPAPLAPGARVEVTVYADEGPATAGELSAPIEVEMPPGTDRVDIRVLFVPSGHFREGPSHRSFAIERGRPATERLTFVVTVRSEKELLAAGGELAQLDEAELMAAFDHRGRPAGFVTRRVKIAISPPESAETAPKEISAPGTTPHPVSVDPPSALVPALTTRPPGLAVTAGAQLPDMVVRILPHPNNNGRQFLCSVVAPALGEVGAGDAAEEWNLPQVTSELVQLYMKKHFIQTDAAARVAALRGSGKQFFNAAPENFKRLYWKLVDAGTPPKSIAVVSVEPHIPWELMLPERDPGASPRRMRPLGVQAMIGRWTRTQGTSGTQSILLKNSRVITPTYPSKPLAHAKEEAELVTRTFPGSVISPADITTIRSEIRAAGELTLLHFTCHGSANGSEQTLILDNGYPLSSVVVSGMEELETLFACGQTMVFLNACEVGQTNTSLSGVGGFASAFIELGAVAVIAPLWAVRDSIAFAVATAVYKGILADPTRPFAEILRDLRAKAYDTATGEDTYAAYCFYGDPLARLVAHA